MSGHRKHCPLMGCVGCGPEHPEQPRLPDVHDYAASVDAVLPVDFTGVEQRILDYYLDQVPPPRFQRIEDTA